MSETVDKCIECEASVRRCLTRKSNIYKNDRFGQKKPGEVVKQYIEDIKEEVKKEKKRILSQEESPK